MKLKLKKGLELRIEGAIELQSVRKIDARLFAVNPDDFPGFKPKVDVNEGDTVLAGTPIMHDKNNQAVKLVSPVKGVVKAVVRGERRKIMRVEIEADAAMSSDGHLKFHDTNPADRERAIGLLAESGLLAEIRQRPYDIVPVGGDIPRDIFITAIDSAPLAASMEHAVNGKEKALAAGVSLLKTICPGKIYVSVSEGSTLDEITGSERVEICGKHPAGNPGVQAANIAPVNKGETIWTLDIVTLGRIGTLVLDGIRDCSVTVAVTGPEVAAPSLIHTFEGASIGEITDGLLKPSDHHVRIISGNVLTGIAEGAEGFLRFPYRQVTAIAEGDDKTEFMGWASLSPSKASVSPTFPGHFLNRAFTPDARLNGSRRAMIMSGEYDKVFPMDILPEYLLKAIISQNIDDMEKLGIYEVAPEDFAAAEYVDTSKLPLQQIVREGLDYLREALE